MWYNFPKTELCTLFFPFSPLVFFLSLYSYLEKALLLSSYNWNTANLGVNKYPYFQIFSFIFQKIFQMGPLFPSYF